MAAGEVVWVGVESLGDRDGRVALYLTDHLVQLRPPATVEPPAEATRERAILEHLAAHGASFFSELHNGAGGGYPRETVDALWNLVWSGRVTNDALHALRAFTRTRATRRRARRPDANAFRSRRLAPPTTEGRWSLVASGRADATPSRHQAQRESSRTHTRWLTAMAQQLLARYGVMTREVAAAESISGGFGAVYDVLKALEEAGRVRRGYFVGGVGAPSSPLPAALDLLRALAVMPDDPEVVVLAATDPANPYGDDPEVAGGAVMARPAGVVRPAGSARSS